MQGGINNKKSLTIKRQGSPIMRNENKMTKKTTLLISRIQNVNTGSMKKRGQDHLDN